MEGKRNTVSSPWMDCRSSREDERKEEEQQAWPWGQKVGKVLSESHDD